jgi:hypothetical protein
MIDFKNELRPYGEDRETSRAIEMHRLEVAYREATAQYLEMRGVIYNSHAPRHFLINGELSKIDYDFTPETKAQLEQIDNALKSIYAHFKDMAERQEVRWR